MAKIDRTAIRLAAKIRGCTCTPDITHRTRKGIRHVSLHHDRDCPAANTESQLLLARGRHQTASEFGEVAAAVARRLSA